MSKINSLTLDHQWRLIFRKAKTKEIKKDLEILKSTFERINDRYISEEQYMMSLRSHLQSLDSFVGVQNERLEKMKHLFGAELSIMKREYEAEKTYMVTRHAQKIDELKDVYVAFDRYFLQKEQTARSEYANIRDGMKNKLIEDKHSLRIKLEKKVESILAEFNNLRTNYLKATEERRVYYDDLQKRNDQAMKDIAIQVSLIHTLSDAIAAERARINSLNDEFGEKNRSLREEKENLSCQLIGMKKMVNRLKDHQRHKLIKMVKISDDVQKSLAKLVKEVNIIIGLGEMCRQLEDEEETILPFVHPCSLYEEEKLLLDDKKLESVSILIKNKCLIILLHLHVLLIPYQKLKPYEQLDIFWRRFSKVQLDKLALLKERQILEEENRRLKAIVARYLENLSVNEKVMSHPNSLLIICDKLDIIVDPAMRKRCERPVATVKFNGALMDKDDTVLRQK
ncbi:unnamed protein product [Rodentolepis nana]|uniref:Coiled-coil domain-containing protein 63 n=1 Tax=Rodentolepis nana TaxID=102285 RepID=A0A0R3T4W0_RODNA|nr:unnamed protein product [Rodentolepis nana]